MNKGRVHFCLLYLNPKENGNTSVERFSRDFGKLAVLKCRSISTRINWFVFAALDKQICLL